MIQCLMHRPNRSQDNILHFQTVLVTGASTGIGAAIAIELASAGYSNLALTATRADKLAEVEAECKARGAENVLVMVKDLSKPRETCESIVKETMDKFGRIGKQF